MARFVRSAIFWLVGGIALVALPVLAAVTTNFSSNQGVSVARVRSGEHPGFSRIVLDATNQVNFKYETSPDGRNIAVELPNIRWNTKESHIYKKSKNIDRVEFVPGQKGGGTVLIEGKNPIGLRWVRGLQPHGKRGHRLVVDVAPKGATTLPTKGTFAKNVIRDGQGQVASAPPSALPKSRKMAAAPKSERQPLGADTMPEKPSMGDKMEGTRAKPYMALRTGLYLASDGSLELDDPAGSHDVTTDTPFSNGLFSGAIGVDWAPTGIPLRNEFEINLRLESEGDISSTNRGTGVVQSGTAELSSLNFMINTYYDFSLGSGFSPYLGLGLGFSRNRLEVSTNLNTFNTDATTTFAWAIMAGAGYRMAPNWLIDFGYRFLDAGELRSNLGTSANAGRQFND
ncbi:MAG TPA: hypothetical protein DCE33_10565, partial [Rhodospirillaceae bacterium]|nr:hypothetical protein [Rhodospirillaceae bacterium]